MVGGRAELFEKSLADDEEPRVETDAGVVEEPAGLSGNAIRIDLDQDRVGAFASDRIRVSSLRRLDQQRSRGRLDRARLDALVIATAQKQADDGLAMPMPLEANVRAMLHQRDRERPGDARDERAPGGNGN